jgi:methionine-rich copper-binding protein CopC
MFLRKIALTLTVLLVATLTLTLAMPQEAFGHAQKLGESPAPNSANSKVAVVSVTFNEKVKAEPTKFKVFNADSKEIKGRFATTQNGKGIQLTFPKNLKKGSYYARYSVISEDGHVVSNSWGFIVGAAPKGSFKTSLKSSSNQLIALDARSNSKGVYRINAKVDTLDFRSQKLGLTLAATKVSENTFEIVLPLKGLWLVSAGVDTSKFKQEKYIGQVVVK